MFPHYRHSPSLNKIKYNKTGCLKIAFLEFIHWHHVTAHYLPGLSPLPIVVVVVTSCRLHLTADHVAGSGQGFGGVTLKEKKFVFWFFGFNE